jgi:hypothetical protein
MAPFGTRHTLLGLLVHRNGVANETARYASVDQFVPADALFSSCACHGTVGKASGCRNWSSYPLSISPDVGADARFTESGTLLLAIG